MIRARVWIWVTVFATICAILAHGIHWERGPHHDDYFLYSWSAQQLLDWMWVEVRPIGKLFMVAMYQSPELFTRSLAFLLVAGTAVLAALLIYRTTRQALPATFVGLVSLAPFAGVEAVVWTSAKAHFAPAGFFALLSLNLFLSALETRTRMLRLFLGGLSATILAMAFGSIEPALNFYIMFVALALYVGQETKNEWKSTLTLLLFSSAALLAWVAIIYLVFYVDADQVTRRGAIEIPTLHRVIDFLNGYHTRAFGSVFGQDIQYVSYREGVAALVSNPWVISLAIVAIVSAILFIVEWPKYLVRTLRENALISGWIFAILVIFSFATTVATMLFPAVLLSNEGGSPRMAYLPGVAFSLALGYSLAAISQKYHSKLFLRIVLIVTASLALVLTLRTFGYTKMYQLRQELDQQQIFALKKAVPPSLIGAQKITFLPLSISEEFIDYSVRTNPRYILLGGFTSPNSVRTILQEMYTEAVEVIRPRYGEMRWRIEPGVDGKNLTVTGLESDGPRLVNSDSVIIFRYGKEGLIDVVDRISYYSDDRGHVLDVRFPLATEINSAVGTPAITLNLPLDKPEYVSVRE